MADIRPFKGTLYNSEKIRDLSKVVAPPYDVISPEEQEKLYNSDPYNIIHILFGKDFSEDTEKDNKYTRAANFLKTWQEEGILKKDDNGAIYIYLQEFVVDKQVKRRLGFIALLKLEEFGTETASVYPHENTLLAPKEDRYRLISSIEANLGPIFALFADEDKTIDNVLASRIKSSPIIDIVDFQGIRNKVWRISDKAAIKTITHLMRDKKLFIADGHHRYEVGLGFSKLKKDQRYGYILTYFTDLYADGIVIFPVHRMISGVSNDVLTDMEKTLEKDFVIKELLSKKDAKDFLHSTGPSQKRFVMYKGDSRFKGLSLDDNDSLDVTLLQKLIIWPLQEKMKAQKEKISIAFTKDLDYAVTEVDSGRVSLAIMLNSAKVREVQDMAFSGKRMPEKSTYFYPKVLTGLVINIF